MLKLLLVLAGTVALILGLIGIIVPGIPTAPFLLLAALLYARSSEKLYRLLIRNKYIGPRILDFHETGRLTLKTKVCSIAIMWVMIVVSCGLFVSILWAQLLLISAGIAGTVVMDMLFRSAWAWNQIVENVRKSAALKVQHTIERAMFI